MVIQSLKNGVGQMLNIIFSKGTAVGLAIGLSLGILRDLIVSNPVGIGNPKADVAFSFLELIALMIPALAIMLQIAVQYSRSTSLEASGAGTELRIASFVMVGIATILLVFVVLLIDEYLILSPIMTLALRVLAIALFVLGLIPVAMAYLARDGYFGKVERTIATDEFFQSVGNLEELDESDLEKAAQRLNPEIPQNDEVSGVQGDNKLPDEHGEGDNSEESTSELRPEKSN